MNKPIDDFFDSKNTIKNIDQKEYGKLNDYLAPIRAFARTTYHSIYVIDYFTQGFEFVSSNPLFLCGLSSEEVQDMGYAFYLDKVIEEDRQLLIDINQIGFEFYENIPTEERLKYHISYDFHIEGFNSTTPTLINHRLTPIFLNDEGKIWKALCIVSLSHHKDAGHIVITREDDNTFYRYDLERSVWLEQEELSLDEREKEIISLSSRGLSVDEIGQKLYLSKDAVKYHRKKLFEKLSVRNISEAVAYVKYKSLI